MTTEANQPAVVAGIDGSDTALGAARWAAEFATRHALPLTLLHAVPHLDWHFASADPPPELDRDADGDRPSRRLGANRPAISSLTHMSCRVVEPG